MDPTALTAEQAARLLGVKAEVIRRHTDNCPPYYALAFIQRIN